jgi:hypothetical protein
VVSGTRPRDCLAVAATVAVEAGDATRSASVLLAELASEPRRRAATLLCSPGAREIEAFLRGGGLAAAARGRFCHLCLDDEEESLDQLAAALPGCRAGLAVVQVPGDLWVRALESRLEPSGGILVADAVSERSMAALAVGELRDRALAVRVETRAPSALAARRALAGVRPGGAASARAARIARALVGPLRGEESRDGE